jgi:hypothetical protein
MFNKSKMEGTNIDVSYDVTGRDTFDVTGREPRDSIPSNPLLKDD